MCSGSATQLPEAAAAKKSGGSTFDTLSGNALDAMTGRCLYGNRTGFRHRYG